MKILGKELVFNVHLFEMCLTLGFTVLATIYGMFNYPEDVPVALLQYMAMIGLLGFLVGFILSNFLVYLYKEIQKSFKK